MFKDREALGYGFQTMTISMTLSLYWLAYIMLQ